MSKILVIPGFIRDPAGVNFTGVLRFYYSNAALGSADGSGLSCNGAYIRYDVLDGNIVAMFRVTGTHADPVPVSPLLFESPFTAHIQYIYTTNYDSEGYKCYHTSLRYEAKGLALNLGVLHDYLYGTEHDRKKALDKAFADCLAERATLVSKFTLLQAAVLDANKQVIDTNKKLVSCEDSNNCLAEGSLELTNKLNEQEIILADSLVANKQLIDALNALELIDRTGNLAKCETKKECLEIDLASKKSIIVLLENDKSICASDVASKIIELDLLQKENTLLDTNLSKCKAEKLCVIENLNIKTSDLLVAQTNLDLKIAELAQVNRQLELAEEVEYKTKLDTCEANYSCLQETATELKTKIIDLEEAIKVLEFDKNNLELALTFAQELDYQNLYTKSEAENKCLKHELMITSNYVKEVLSQLANAESRLTTCSELVTTKDKEANKLKSEYTDIKAKFDCCSTNLTTSKNDIVDLTSSNTSLTATNATLTSDLATKDKESNTSKSKLAALTTQYDCAQTKISELNSDIVDLTSSNTSLIATNATLTSDLATKDKESNTSKSKLAALTTQYDCAQTKISELNSDIVDLTSSNTSLIATNATLTSDLATKDKESQTLNNKYESCNNDLLCLQDRLSTSNLKLNNLQAINQNLATLLADETAAKETANTVTADALEKLYNCLNDKCLRKG